MFQSMTVPSMRIGDTVSRFTGTTDIIATVVSSEYLNAWGTTKVVLSDGTILCDNSRGFCYRVARA